MYNQIEAVLSQYELEIYEVVKGRGTYICRTDQGKKVLTGFRGSKEKGMVLRDFLKELEQNGFAAEQIVLNRNLDAVTEDEFTGESFILKDHVEGMELDVYDPRQSAEAVKVLAHMHKVSARIDLSDRLIRKQEGFSAVQVRQRHYRELIKTGNYIRNRKQKNEFERMFLRAYGDMLATAEHSLSILLEQEKAQKEYQLCHGDCNQHNMIAAIDGWRIVHFENFAYNWKETDLANFLRKILEKNNWNIELGLRLVENYDAENKLKENEGKCLYGLLLFPEKFWKITNHYINSRKNRISDRDVEKLSRVIRQEEERLNFAEKLFSILPE